MLRGKMGEKMAQPQVQTQTQTSNQDEPKLSREEEEFFGRLEGLISYSKKPVKMIQKDRSFTYAKPSPNENCLRLVYDVKDDECKGRITFTFCYNRMLPFTTYEEAKLMIERLWKLLSVIKKEGIKEYGIEVTPYRIEFSGEVTRKQLTKMLRYVDRLDVWIEGDE